MHNHSILLGLLKSLRFRLIILLLLVTVVPGIVIRVGVVNTYESRAISIRKSEVAGQSRILANQIGNSDYLDVTTTKSEALQARIDLLTTIYDGRVIIVDTAYRIVHDTYNLDDNKTIISEEVIHSFAGEEISNYDSENHYIEMTLPITNPEDESGQILGVMLISVSTDNVELTRSHLGRAAWILWGIMAALMVPAGIFLIFWLLRPLRELSEAIPALSDGFGTDTLQVDSCTEISDICEKINTLMSQSKKMNESRQEFVSNVSHELKTPLTSMKVLADSINSMPDAPKELYQEFFADIANEVERETRIINDLLSLVRMDKQAADMNISSVNINELIEQILKRLQPIADKQNVELVLESFRPVTAEIDELKMSLAITNLVENGIKYNRPGGGWVHVTLNADHQYFYLKVEDNGMGIPEESLEHIFERFYRVDKSHSREIGGNGLGLAITRSSILMHRGAIKVFSVLEEGTTFDVRIPLTYISK